MTPCYSLIPRALGVECLAGAIGGAAKQAVIHPFETLATLSEVRRSGEKPTALSLRVLLRKPARLYSGYLVTVMLNIPYAIMFHSAMYFCSLMMGPNISPVARRLVSSAVGAVFASIIGVPLETIKVDF